MGIARVSPSILAADFGRLAEQIAAVESAGAESLHLDVMDGHFVPNISFGPPVIESVRRITGLQLWAHLMIEEPEKYLEAFIACGVNGIIVHQEVEEEAAVLAGRIKEMGVGAGLAVNPPTPVDDILETFPVYDRILIMSVHPGFGGQSFMKETLQKVRTIRGRFPSLPVAMDGGIAMDTVSSAAEAGVTILVAGSAVFRRDDPAAAFRDLEDAARKAAGNPVRTADEPSK